MRPADARWNRLPVFEELFQAPISKLLKFLLSKIRFESFFDLRMRKVPEPKIQ